MTVTVTLPHPAKELHPNARPHFMARARAKKHARQVAYLVALSALRDALAQHDPSTPATFTPTHYYLRWSYWGNIPDEDNCLAACKAYLDGCCDALGINDKTLSSSGIARVHSKPKQVELIFSDEN